MLQGHFLFRMGWELKKAVRCELLEALWLQAGIDEWRFGSTKALYVPPHYSQVLGTAMA